MKFSMKRSMKRGRLHCLLSAAVFMLSSAAFAVPMDEAQRDLEILQHKFTEGSYSKKGADNCMMCHKKHDGVSDIFLNTHGNMSGQNTPMAGLQCEACHGPQGKHKGKNEPMISFGENSPLSAEMQNSVCLGCHQNEADNQWHTSIHHLEEVTCTSCHQLHTAADPILAPATQAQVCQDCHQAELADFHKRSSHPVANGSLTCTDCHNPHGDIGPKATKGATMNDTCYACHSEKQTPTLFAHAPVFEDCSNCHTAHGSVNDNLLKARVPLLCKECHGEVAHAANVPAGNSSATTAGQGCLNCHSQIHGSNHPMGNTFQH